VKRKKEKTSLACCGARLFLLFQKQSSGEENLFLSLSNCFLGVFPELAFLVFRDKTQENARIPSMDAKINLQIKHVPGLIDSASTTLRKYEICS